MPAKIQCHLEKREAFAVSLRHQKKQRILADKRTRLAPFPKQAQKDYSAIELYLFNNLPEDLQLAQVDWSARVNYWIEHCSGREADFLYFVWHNVVHDN
jgi:hypothetical protein